MRFRFQLRMLPSLALLAGLSCFYAAKALSADPEVIVLGIAQDAGFPQAGCRRDCCALAWSDAEKRKFSSCLAIIDPDTKQRWLLDCTPDFRDQLRLLDELTPWTPAAHLDGIFLTHAHVGHYLGLAQLGREVIGARGVSVYAMPRMKFFLESNGPWDQLVELKQIEIVRLQAGTLQALNDRISITPFLVPHRDEYSETVGFEIVGPNRKVIYLPDIDKWKRWEVDINQVVQQADRAFLDGTFYDGAELPGRDMTEIPHPFIVESLQRLSPLADFDRNKVFFLHLNHTNPLLHEGSAQRQGILEKGFHVAEQGSSYKL